MNAILVLTAGIEALAGGAELVTVLDRLAQIRARMRLDGRADVTTQELDFARGRIQALQDSINRA